MEYLSLNQIDPSYNESYCDIPQKNKKQYSFLLPHPEGKSHEREWEEDGYKVTMLSPGKQLIEIYTNTDDYKFTSIYLAEEKRIKPLRSKCFGPGQVFQAAPPAVFFAFGLYGLGRWLRHKYYPDSTDPASFSGTGLRFSQLNCV